MVKQRIGFFFKKKEKEKDPTSEISKQAVDDIFNRMSELGEIVDTGVLSKGTVDALVNSFIDLEQQNIQYFVAESEDAEDSNAAGLATVLSAFALEMAVLKGVEEDKLAYFRNRFYEDYLFFNGKLNLETETQSNQEEIEYGNGADEEH